MRSTTKLALSAALCLPALATSCTAPTVVEAEESPQRHRALTDEFVVFENASVLANRILLEEVRRDPDAVPPVVQFELRNASTEPCHFMYRCKWLDGNGIMISSSTEGWDRKTILGRARMSLTCVAPRPSAVDYRLVLQPWRR